MNTSRSAAPMNESHWLTRLLSIGGEREALIGLGLLAMPSAISSLLLGAPLTGVGPVVARLAGGALLALGISCWVASAALSSRMRNGVAGAFLIYNCGNRAQSQVRHALPAHLPVRTRLP